VLPLRVVIKNILLDFIAFSNSVILVQILEVILHELIRKVSVRIATDQEPKDDLDRSDDTSNVSQQVQNRVHPTAVNNFLIVKEQADTHDGASHLVEWVDKRNGTAEGDELFNRLNRHNLVDVVLVLDFPELDVQVEALHLLIHLADYVLDVRAHDFVVTFRFDEVRNGPSPESFPSPPHVTSLFIHAFLLSSEGSCFKHFVKTFLVADLHAGVD
jgi:hypothetical protein